MNYEVGHYEESIGTKMNDLNLCLEVGLRSCQLLRHWKFGPCWFERRRHSIANLRANDGYR